MARPLTVHGLLAGQPLCGFVQAPPVLWPDGHWWVGPDDYHLMTCPDCWNARPVGRIDGLTLARAQRVAVAAHQGQTDKQGEPYIAHVVRVAAAMPAGDPTLRSIAWLHDVVEDTPITLKDLTSFGPEIVDAIDAISRREGEEYYDYIKRCGGNPLARLVKIADLQDNLRPGVPATLSRRYRASLLLLGADMP